MWNTLQHEENLYMIKIMQNDIEDNVKICLTDFQNMWIQDIAKGELLQQFQEANPLFDIKVEKVVSEVIETINNISNLENFVITKNGDELELVINVVKSEYKMQFKFNLNKSTPDIFLKEITVPLIQTVKHLEERQNVLINLLQKKDRELEEYKLEKGVISRDDLTTEKFDESKMSTIDDKSMMDVFGRNETFWQSFVNQHGNIEATFEDVKQDPWNHIKRKRKIYSSKTVTKKGKGINYGNK